MVLGFEVFVFEVSIYEVFVFVTFGLENLIFQFPSCSAEACTACFVLPVCSRCSVLVG